MNERWIRVGTGFSHLLKLTGSTTYTTACYKAIPKGHVEYTTTVRVGMAGAPGKYLLKPAETDDWICPICLGKAWAQV